MKKIAIVTDSNSGITQEMGKTMGIHVIPMPFFIDGELFLEDITLTQEEFYKRLGEDSDISTSQPSPGEVMECWDELLKEYDEIVLRDAGKSASEIKEILEAEKLQASIYITVDTLKYLKKGGRVTPAAAALGTVLNLKPVLQIQGEKLDAFSKVRGWKAAKRTMLKAIEKDLNDRFADVREDMVLGMAYTCSKEEAQEWKQEIAEKFPEYEIVEGPLSLSVACHIGPGAMAVTCMKKVR